MKLNFLNVIIQKFKNRPKRAFSLNDLSVLMSTVAIVAVSSVAISNIQNSEEKEKADSEKIEAIYKSIGSFLLEKKRLPCPADIERIARKVKEISFYGIIQSDLTFSGVEIALWDLLGKAKEVPV
jgi:hypothetical protein